MQIYQKPLVAVDGSESSLHAFKEALKLAPREQDLPVLAVAPLIAGISGPWGFRTSIRCSGGHVKPP